MEINDFKTDESGNRPECSIDTFETFARLYRVEPYDVNSVAETYLCHKEGVQLKSGLIRPPYDREEASYVVDLIDQECACEAFNRMHSRGACKHLRALNFAKTNDAMEILIK